MKFSESLILSNWTYFLPLALFLIALRAVLRSNQSSQPNKVPLSSTQKKKLSEEEYIGEFDPESEEPGESPALEDKPHVSWPGATVTLPAASPLEAARLFNRIMSNRRSVRMFSDKPVPFEIVERCVAAAASGPSGAHTEPWTYCVVSDPKLKTAIREIVEAEEYENYLQRMSRRWVVDLKPLKTTFEKEYLALAPHLVLVFKQTYGVLPNGKKRQHYYNEISTSISVGILLSALQCSGLSSLVTTPLNCGPALARLLGRPRNEKLLVLLPVGYPAADCTIPDLQRRPIEDVLVQY